MKKLTYFVCFIVIGLAVILASPKYRDLSLIEGINAMAQDFFTEYLNTGGTHWIAKDLVQGTTYTSNPIDVSKCAGYISLDIQMGNATRGASATFVGSGNGTTTWKFLVSNDGQNFIDPPNISNTIVSAFGITSGDGSDGKAFYQVSPPPCKYIEFTAQNTAASGNISATALINVH